MIEISRDGTAFRVSLDAEHRGAAETFALHGDGQPAELVLSAELVGELVRLALADPSGIPQDDARDVLGRRGR